MTSQNKAPDAGGNAEGNVEVRSGKPNPKKLTRQQRWRKRNPRAYVAHLATAAALKHGLIEKHPCAVCGDPKAEAHHPRYDRPFDVVWLCRKCHKAEHRKAVQNG